MKLNRVVRAAAAALLGLVLLGGDCSDAPEVYTTPGELVGQWRYVAWSENGLPRDLAEYYSCTPTFAQCLPAATTYAARAEKTILHDDRWAYQEIDGAGLEVYNEAGATTVAGDLLLLKITHRAYVQLTPSEWETEKFTWEISSDTLVLTRVLNPSTTWVFKLVK
jgi:hypothetical protein